MGEQEFAEHAFITVSTNNNTNPKHNWCLSVPLQRVLALGCLLALQTKGLKAEALLHFTRRSVAGCSRLHSRSCGYLLQRAEYNPGIPSALIHILKRVICCTGMI